MRPTPVALALVCGAVGAGSVAVHSLTAEYRYRAQATLQVLRPPLPGTARILGLHDAAGLRRRPTADLVMSSEPVADQILDAAARGDAELVVEHDQARRTIGLVARARGPREAARLANDAAVRYRDLRTNVLATRVADMTRLLRLRAAIQRAAETDGRRSAGDTTDARSQLRAVAAFEASNVQLVRRAVPPSSPARHASLGRDLTAATLLGAALGWIALAATSRRASRSTSTTRSS